MGISINLKVKLCSNEKNNVFVDLDGLMLSNENKTIDCNLNITHNLGEMASKVKINKKITLYDVVWRPHRIFNIPDNEEYTYNKDIMGYEIKDMLKKGLDELKSNPEYYKKFNSSNGWGTYKHFVPFLEKYLNCLDKFKYSYIEVSR